MKNWKRKAISYLLVLVMLLTLCPAGQIPARAAGAKQGVAHADADLASGTDAVSGGQTADNTEAPATEAPTTEASDGENQEFSINQSSLDNPHMTWAEAEGSLLYAGAVQSGFANYKGYMTSYSLDVDGKNISSGSFIDPQKGFNLKLTFELTRADMAEKGLKYYYELPEHVSIGNKGSEDEQISLYNAYNVVIGTYYILNDVLYVTFPGYYDRVVANFYLAASWTGTENASSIDVTWKDTAVTYKIDICDLKIAKNGTSYVNQEDGSLLSTYSVTVYPKDATGAGLNDITFTDNFNAGAMEFKTGTYDEKDEDGNSTTTGQDIKITFYDKTGAVESTEYRSFAQVVTDKSSGTHHSYDMKIEDLSISSGGSFKVEYQAVIPKKERMKIDANNTPTSFINYATASYPYTNPTTGKTDTLSVSTKYDSQYTTESNWIFKEAGDDTKTKETNEGTKYIVPYTLQINKYRYYSLGGGIVSDEITNFTGGDVVYATSGSADTKPHIKAITNAETRNVEQEWIILDDSTYASLAALNKTASDKTSLERLQDDNALEGLIVAAINQKKGTAYTEFTDELAEKYIFTSGSAHNFIWFMPMDSTPTTYWLYYYTIVDSKVGNFKNSASLWYTEIGGAPKGGGVGWRKPVKKVMKSTKTNEGVYIGADGNYYVDYTITVGLEPGSAGFEDIYVTDYFPSKTIEIDGKSYQLIDWLGGPTENYSPFEIQKYVKVSSASADPAVQSVVDNTLIGFTTTYPDYQINWSTYQADQASHFQLADRYINARAIEAAVNATDPYGHYAHTFKRYTGAAVKDAGQFMTGVTEADIATFNSQKNRHYKISSFTSEPYDQTSVGMYGLTFYLGDLPGTDVGYDIVFKYTGQVNPVLVKHLPEVLKKENAEYITNTNTCYVKQLNYEGTGQYNIYPTSGTSGRIQTASSSYWIGVKDDAPVLKKSFSSFDEKNKRIAYEVKINEDKSLTAANVKYEIADQLNISGMKYVDKSLTLKDDKNKIIYTNENGKSADTKYKNKVTYTCTTKDDTNNGFLLTLDNTGGIFTGTDGKLIPMTLTYKVALGNEPTSTTIVNVVSAKVVTVDEKTGEKRTSVIGQDECQYVHDEALGKYEYPDSNPCMENNYTMSFYIDVNPNSKNAKEMADMKAGDVITVRDTMCSALRLLPDSVTIVETKKDGTVADITDSCPKTQYYPQDGVAEFYIKIPDKTSKYRISYDARLLSSMNTVVEVSNKAEIVGSSVKPTETITREYIAEYNQDAYAEADKIQLIKYDKNDSTKRLQATFDLYKYDSSDKTWTLLTTQSNGYNRIKTNENGEVTIENKIVSKKPVTLVDSENWYKLVEVETEPGYMVRKEPIYYYVSTGPLPEKIPSDVKDYTLAVVPDSMSTAPVVYPIVYVDNRRISFDLEKQDMATGERLDGAEFTLYSDAACTNVLKTETVVDGMASFEDLEVANNAVCYLKETRTPAGYVESSEVFTLRFENGRIVSVTGSAGGKSKLILDGEVPKVVMYNLKNDGSIKVTKKVSYQYRPVAEDKAFAFVIKIYDPEGNEYNEFLNVTRTAPDGSVAEEPEEYRSGHITTLKANESIQLNGIPNGCTYTVTEVPDNSFSTKITVVDNIGVDGNTVDGTTVSGTVEQGSADDITVTNTQLGKVVVEKQCMDEGGGPMDIPDGLTIRLTDANNATVYAAAKWDASIKKFVLVSLYKDSMVFSNDRENGFEVLNMPDVTLYVHEDNYNLPDANVSCITKIFRKTKEEGTYYLADTLSHGEGYIKVRNQYTSNYASVPVSAKKTINKPLTGADFTFRLYEKRTSGGDLLLYERTNNGNGDVNFPDLTYTAKDKGTHTYYIKEDVTGTTYTNGVRTKDGITYDTSQKQFTVTVEVADDGKVTATGPEYSASTKLVDVVAENGTTIVQGPEFVNHYDAKGSIRFLGSKTLRGGASGIKAGQFRFTIQQVKADYITPVTDKETGNPVKYTGTTQKTSSQKATINYATINYDANDIDETYHYIVSEDIPAGVDGNGYKAGVTYSTYKYHVDVAITDNGDGTLKATPTYMDETGNPLVTAGGTPVTRLDFVNEYKAEGHTTFTATKRMLYQDIEEGQFEFTVTEYTTSSRNKVKQDDDGHDIVYTATVDAASMDPQTAVATADITFPTIYYDAGDLGNHYYKVAEVIPVDAVDNVKDNIRYSTTTYNVTVTVKDKGDGTLDVKSSGASSMQFENQNTKRGTAQFKGTKRLMGRDMFADGDFYFWSTGRRTAPDGTQEYYDTPFMAGASMLNGQIYFPEFTATAANVGYTYEYYIYEWGPRMTTPTVAPPQYPLEEPYTYMGVTFDPNYYIVKATVSDNGDGTLGVDVEYQDKDGNTLLDEDGQPAEGLAFVNTYDAEATLTFKAGKILNGRQLEEGQFNFAIYEDNEVVATGTNDAEGVITFTPIRFYIDGEPDGVESYIGTHDYVVREVIPETPEPGYTYDDTEYEITVTATDNLDGTIKLIIDSENEDKAGLTYEIEVPETKEATFENGYEAKGELTLSGTKTLEGRTLDAGEFTFIAVEYKLSDGEKKTTGRTLLGTNDANGKISFEKASFVLNDTQDDRGIYSYEVKELAPVNETDTKGITYDKNTYSFDAFVTDNGDGTLSVVAGEVAQKLDFTNTYEASGTLPLSGKKSIENEDKMVYKTEKKDYAFAFDVYEVDSFEAFAKAETKQELAAYDIASKGYSMADGSIEFSDIVYDAADAGTHRYVICESADYTRKDVLNVAAPISMTVTVTDNRDGTLKIEALLERDGETVEDMEFTNKATEVEIKKVDPEGISIDGAVMEVKDANGKVVYTFTSSKDRTEKVYGLYKNTRYTLHEKSAPKGYRTAPDIPFYLDEDGKLYTEEPVEYITMVDRKVGQRHPPTGDSAKVPFVIVMAILSMGGVVLVEDKRRKKRR